MLEKGVLRTLKFPVWTLSYKKYGREASFLTAWYSRLDFWSLASLFPRKWISGVHRLPLTSLEGEAATAPDFRWGAHQTPGRWASCVEECLGENLQFYLLWGYAWVYAHTNVCVCVCVCNSWYNIGCFLPFLASAERDESWLPTSVYTAC